VTQIFGKMGVDKGKYRFDVEVLGGCIKNKEGLGAFGRRKGSEMNRNS
jgi:hypothetical protein